MNSDFVFINDMDLSCHVGTSNEEKSFSQILRVNVRIYLPLSEAGTQDSLEKTIDYADIIRRIRTRIQQHTYTLVEAIAEDIARIILESPQSIATEVEVNKKVFEGIRAVGTFIRREKKSP